MPVLLLRAPDIPGIILPSVEGVPSMPDQEPVSNEIRELLAKRTDADSKRHQLESDLHKHYAMLDDLEAKLLRAGASMNLVNW